ncbi:MAG TPA: enoyl-CoA hydratase-related protein [Caulobacteraceae bacterium]|jgi:2-(1,2-epoxy-1,2-dihydrophenyl)acetyl-CoA isomerase|nr:enoyl-CoA hydratase-related protein [Caulobacteraceae bacterium]
MAGDKLNIDVDGTVAIVALADPSTLNAIGPGLCAALTEAFRALAAGGEVRAAILTGEGRAFCSGANLMDASATIPAEGGPPDLERVVQRYYNPLVETLRALPFPLLTAVNGPAAGIGCALALAGDLAVAAEGASFTPAFRRVGLVPDGGTTWLLPRLVGRARAMEMVLLGETFSAARALEWGLINRCVADAELAPTALRLARNLAEGPASLALTRRLMWDSLDRTWPEQLAAEAAAQGTAGRTEDFKEGVAAFLQKRPPQFSGR